MKGFPKRIRSSKSLALICPEARSQNLQSRDQWFQSQTPNHNPPSTDETWDTWSDTIALNSVLPFSTGVDFWDQKTFLFKQILTKRPSLHTLHQQKKGPDAHVPPLLHRRSPHGRAPLKLWGSPGCEDARANSTTRRQKSLHIWSNRLAVYCKVCVMRAYCMPAGLASTSHACTQENCHFHLSRFVSRPSAMAKVARNSHHRRRMES